MASTSCPGWTSQLNSYDAQFSYICPGNQYVAGVSSVHNSHHEDRMYYYNYYYYYYYFIILFYFCYYGKCKQNNLSTNIERYLDNLQLTSSKKLKIIRIIVKVPNLASCPAIHSWLFEFPIELAILPSRKNYGCNMVTHHSNSRGLIA